MEVIKDDTKQTLVLDCHYPEDEVGITLVACQPQPALGCDSPVTPLDWSVIVLLLNLTLVIVCWFSESVENVVSS